MLQELVRAAYDSGSITRIDEEIFNFSEAEVREGVATVGLADLSLDPADFYLASTVIEAMQQKGWSPANLSELAVFAVRDWQEQRRVVALGQTWINQQNLEDSRSGYHDCWIPFQFVGMLALFGRRQLHRALVIQDIATHPWSGQDRFLVVPSL